MEINWRKIKKIFFVGIKGVGMAPLAVIAKEGGFEVEGCDIDEEFITDEMLVKKEITIYKGFRENDLVNFFSNTSLDSCLVVTTGAHSGYNNPIVLKAKDLGIKYLNQGQALAAFMSGKPFNRKFKSITITGSHGKTTTSALMSSALVSLGLDPSYSVGTSMIFPIGPSGHYGGGEFFIAEGDEYVGEPVFDRTPKILYQKPNFAIISNIDFDHPDIYSDIEDVKKVMLSFVNGMEQNGVIFVNGDDKNLQDLVKAVRDDIRVITFGESGCDFKFQNIEENIGYTEFEVVKNGNFFGDFKLNVPARHNVNNALSVISFLDSLGIENHKIKNAIASFKGSKRRMEVVGELISGALVVDDYGHHPLEITSTLDALKKFYHKKIICIFQSHTYSRTRKLLDEFSSSFNDVDELILLPIFKSQRDTESDSISYEEFQIPFRSKVPNVYSALNIDDACQYLEKKGLDDSYLIVTIGAGDVYKVGYKLVNK